jgi:hypothetical protein
MKSWVNHEGHKADEGYDLGAGLKPAPKKIIFLSVNFVRFALSFEKLPASQGSGKSPSSTH